MKIFLTAVTMLAFTTMCRAEGIEPSVQDLRNEIAQLKTTLAKAQDQAVSNFETSVQIRQKYEVAVQRIGEANDVARQWRSKSVNLQRELAYAKAIAAGTTTVDLQKVYTASETPHFRIDNIPARAEAVIRDEGVSPYISMR